MIRTTFVTLSENQTRAVWRCWWWKMMTSATSEVKHRRHSWSAASVLYWQTLFVVSLFAVRENCSTRRTTGATPLKNLIFLRKRFLWQCQQQRFATIREASQNAKRLESSTNYARLCYRPDMLSGQICLPTQTATTSARTLSNFGFSIST